MMLTLMVMVMDDADDDDNDDNNNVLYKKTSVITFDKCLELRVFHFTALNIDL